MDLPRALDQIAEIRAAVTRVDVYRGYRPVPVAASGAVGLLAAAFQPAELPLRDPAGFVLYWVAVAAAAGLIGVSETLYNYLAHEDRVSRLHTRRVIGQFLPGLAAGAAITVSVLQVHPSLIPLLPGLWALCFGIGVFASRPFLPRAAGLVAVYYYAAGIALLWSVRMDTLSGWHVGATFGAGQLLGAAVLQWSVDRDAAGGTQEP